MKSYIFLFYILSLSFKTIVNNIISKAFTSFIKNKTMFSTIII